MLLQWAKSGTLVEFPPVRPRCDESDQDWMNEANESSAQLPLWSIVTSPDWEVPATIRHRTEAADRLDAMDWRSEVGTAEVERTEHDLEGLFRQFARFGESLLIVDPYLSPDSKSYRPLGNIIVRASKGTRLRKVEFHCRRNKEARAEDLYAQFRTQWAGRFADAQLSGRVVVWSPLVKLHDRFLLSATAGAACTNGFDIIAPGGEKNDRTLMVSLLSRPMLEKKWGEFSPEAHEPRLELNRVF